MNMRIRMVMSRIMGYAYACTYEYGYEYAYEYGSGYAHEKEYKCDGEYGHGRSQQLTNAAVMDLSS